ncbi:MAG: helicase-exonuclease AddAB subunit AddB [Clostridiaceae bacterium]
MSLNLVLGRSGCGKSHCIYEDIEKSLKKNPDKNIIIIVPEQFTFETEKMVLNTFGEENSFNIKVLNFKRLCYRAFQEVGGSTQLFINNSGRNMIIHKILQENIMDLKSFGSAARQKGFISVLSDTITELKRYDLTPEELLEAQSTLSNDNILTNKLHDIELIYRKFQEHIDNSYTDSEDMLNLLVEKLDKYQPLKDSEVWFDEFYTFTPVQYKVIDKIMKYSSRVNVCLLYGEEDVFSILKRTEDKLTKIAMENSIKINIKQKKDQMRYKCNEELKHLEKYYFKYPYEVFNDPTEKLTITVNSNPYNEIEEVAKDISTLIREKGFRYKDIAIVTRNIDGYSDVVKSIFQEYKIPYYIDVKKPLMDNLIITFITSALEVVFRSWSYESVFKYLKTTIHSFSLNEVDMLENYILANGIKGKKMWFAERWIRPVPSELIGNSTEEEVLEKLNEMKKVIIEPFECLYKLTISNCKVKDICEELFNFMVKSNLVEKIEGYIEKFKTSGQLQLAREYSQIYNIIIDILDQFVEVLGDYNTSIQEFTKILEAGFETLEVGTIPSSVDQVLVGSVERSKSHNIRALFIIGLNDSIFPKVIDREGILNDADRSILNDKGFPLASDTKAAAIEEQLLIYITLNSSQEYLKLSYPIADHEGKSLRPSIIVSRIKSLFKNVTINSNVLIEEKKLRLEDYLEVNPTFNNFTLNIKSEFKNNKFSPLWKETYKWFLENDNYRHRTENVVAALWYSNMESYVDEIKIRELYDAKRLFSVSQFERYSRCPFSYFVHYGLKCRERKIHKLTPPKVGSLLHEVIECFCEEIIHRNIKWAEISKDEISKLIDEIIKISIEKVDNSIFNSTARLKYLTNRLRKVLTRTIEVIAMHIKNSDFVPVGYESEFNFSGKYPPIQLRLSTGEEVKVIGKIDRIDYLEEANEVYVRIIDYKSSAKDFKLSDLYYGFQLQLLVYLDAILEYEKKNKDKTVFPGGILYCKIDNPLISVKKRLSDEKLEEEIIKSLKMKGLVLGETDIIKRMDTSLTDGASKIIPVSIKKDGNLSSKDNSVASKKEFLLLRKYVKKSLVDLCEDMLSGDISIRPYKNQKEIPCTYCEYHSLCQFDDTLEDNCYRNLKALSNEEVYAEIEKEVEGENHED